MLSPVSEDTLKTIYHLERADGPPVSTSAIADRLEKTSATVTSTLDRLHERALIDREPYHGCELTDEGEAVAVEVVRHHRLIETYLAEHLDYPWEHLHREAETLEHHISERFEARLAELLDDPRHDPHGDPIPTADLEPPSRDGTVPLSTCEEGERVVIARVSDRNDEDLVYLADAGITPGTTVRVVDIAPFGMVTLAMNGTEQSVPEEVAETIHVTTSEMDDGRVGTERRRDV